MAVNYADQNYTGGSNPNATYQPKTQAPSSEPAAGEDDVRFMGGMWMIFQGGRWVPLAQVNPEMAMAIAPYSSLDDVPSGIFNKYFDGGSDTADATDQSVLTGDFPDWVYEDIVDKFGDPIKDANGNTKRQINPARAKLYADQVDANNKAIKDKQTATTKAATDKATKEAEDAAKAAATVEQQRQFNVEQAQKEKEFAAGIKSPTVAEMIDAAIFQGNFKAAVELDDFRQRPSQLERLDRALQISRSPADYVTVLSMMRGELPIQQQPGGINRRIGPENQAFGAMGFTGFDTGITQDPGEIWRQAYEKTRKTLLGQGMSDAQADQVARDRATNITQSQIAAPPAGGKIAGNSSSSIAPPAEDANPTGGQAYNDQMAQKPITGGGGIYKDEDQASFDARTDPTAVAATGGSSTAMAPMGGVMSAYSPAIRAIYRGESVAPAKDLSALGAPPLPTTRTLNNLLPSEQEQFGAALENQGIYKPDYFAQQAASRPVAPMSNLASMRPKIAAPRRRIA